MFMSIGLWAQEAVSTHVIVVWDMYMQILYVGRALRTKETLPDFLKWCRVTRHPLVFRDLMDSQRTPGNGASQNVKYVMYCSFYMEKNNNCVSRTNLVIG